MPRKNRRSTYRVILAAIGRRRVLRFTYADLPRVCEPHVLGITNGRRQVLCWQLSGASKGGDPSNWRRFDISEIKNLQVTRDTFPGKRLVPHPHSIWDHIITSV